MRERISQKAEEESLVSPFQKRRFLVVGNVALRRPWKESHQAESVRFETLH